MKYLYLDHNIYIEARDDLQLREYLNTLLEKNLQCIYSPAHIEEIFKVVANETSQYKNKMDMSMEVISEITGNKEVLPTESGLIIKKEDPKECYSRVKGMDTTSRVKKDSETKFVVDKDNYKKSLDKDKQNAYISDISPDKIWEHQELKESINDFNKNRSAIINNYNNSMEVQLLSFLGVDKKLPSTFSLKQGNYSLLKKSHKQLEYTIELLFRMLNFSGYYAEKSEKTSISGTHDVSHSIYATRADYLISTDKRFVKKCQAIYSFLGVETTVIYCKQNEIRSVIDKII